MMPSWPTELERPLRDGYQRQRGDNRRMTQAEQGPPRVRRGRSKSIQTVPMSFYLSYDQEARFQRFYVEETEEGALPFLIPNWGTDGSELLTPSGLSLTDHEDTPLLIAATWVAMFGESVPNTDPMGVEWRVSFNLVILP